MKTTVKNGIVAVLLMATAVMPAFGINASWRTDVEVPGDHFSLEGALELFKKSKSPEEFEKLLNTPETKVNNLDLNGDGDIDYIKVIDRNDGNVHAFILQAVISPTELQDIAVIELEIHSDGKATLQIVGDEDIYGIETIIEPTEEVRINAGTMTASTHVNVWSWPTVQYVYDPLYFAYESPWGWYSRPYWWQPWQPVSYVVYRPYWDSYRPHYTVCHSHRVVYARDFYRPVRRTSETVQDRYRGDITYTRQTRGRDNQYYTPTGHDGRGEERRPSKSSHSRSSDYLAPSSMDRSGDSRLFGKTRTEEPAESTGAQRTDIWSAPRTRTHVNSDREVRTSSPQPSTEHHNRSSHERTQTQTHSVSPPRERTYTPEAHTPSPSTPRESHKPEPRQEQSSPAPHVEVQRGRPSGDGNSGGGSSAPAPVKRGREN